MTRASSVVNCQLTLAWMRSRDACQAATSSWDAACHPPTSLVREVPGARYEGVRATRHEHIAAFPVVRGIDRALRESALPFSHHTGHGLTELTSCCIIAAILPTADRRSGLPARPGLSSACRGRDSGRFGAAYVGSLRSTYGSSDRSPPDGREASIILLRAGLKLRLPWEGLRSVRSSLRWEPPLDVWILRQKPTGWA